MVRDCTRAACADRSRPSIEPGRTARNDPAVGSVTSRYGYRYVKGDANSANCSTWPRRFVRGSLGAAGVRGALQRGTLGCGAGRWPRLARRRPLRHVLHRGRGARALEARAAAGHAVVEARGGRARRDRRRAARHGGGEEATRALRVERAEARGVLEVAPGRCRGDMGEIWGDMLLGEAFSRWRLG